MTHPAHSLHFEGKSQAYRIIESLRLEKTSKIVKSNRRPNTTMPAKPCPEVPHLHSFWTPPGMVTPPLPWAACSNAWPCDLTRMDPHTSGHIKSIPVYTLKHLDGHL